MLHFRKIYFYRFLLEVCWVGFFDCSVGFLVCFWFVFVWVFFFLVWFWLGFVWFLFGFLFVFCLFLNAVRTMHRMVAEDKVAWI